MSMSRLHYIDVFKGILIVLVVIHHVPFVCDKFHNPYLTIYWINNFIIAFFMPAWFVTTGYCCNFNKPFLPYLWSNFKGLMIPCFTLYCVNHVLGCINTYMFEDGSWLTLSYWVNPGIRTFFKEGGFYWFLSALFISKIIYWFLENYISCTIYKGIVCLVLFYFGLFLYTNTSVPNIFFFQHAMILSIFFFSGKLLKIYEKYVCHYGFVISFFYIVVVLIMSFSKIEVPTITRTITVTPMTSLIFFLLSYLGTTTFWSLAKWISKCDILEYMGKGSIVMYAFNYITLTIVANSIINNITPCGKISSILCIIAVILISLITLMFFYWIIDRKIICVILGKF